MFDQFLDFHYYGHQGLVLTMSRTLEKFTVNLSHLARGCFLEKGAKIAIFCNIKIIIAKNKIEVFDLRVRMRMCAHHVDKIRKKQKQKQNKTKKKKNTVDLSR